MKYQFQISAKQIVILNVTSIIFNILSTYILTLDIHMTDVVIFVTLSFCLYDMCHFVDDINYESWMFGVHLWNTLCILNVKKE